jgi:hypothetical protein
MHAHHHVGEGATQACSITRTPTRQLACWAAYINVYRLKDHDCLGANMLASRNVEPWSWRRRARSGSSGAAADANGQTSRRPITFEDSPYRTLSTASDHPHNLDARVSGIFG